MKHDKDLKLLELLKLRAGSGHITDPWTLLILGNSIDHDQLATINDRFGRLAGYVVWANLSKESVFRALRFGRPPISVEDWNEGKFLVVLDVFLSRRVKFSPKEVLSLLPRRRYAFFLRRGFLYTLKPRENTRPASKQRVNRGLERSSLNSYLSIRQP